MFGECIFKDIQLHGLVEVFEEDFAQVVAFADDDCILCIQVAEAGESGAEHRMCRHVAKTAFIVELLQPGLYRGDVADDTVFGQYGLYVAESILRVLYCNGIDNQFRFEFLNLL